MYCGIYLPMLQSLHMVFLNRQIDLKRDVANRSLFLFGPRQTGKTSLLKKQFPHSPFYNLLLADTFLRISQRPHLIREELLSKKASIKNPVIIDEIQKLPLLLDEVQYLIEEKGYRFILTGSSPRKLKAGQANLLGGRARMRQLFPLTSHEIPDFNLTRALNFGKLPSIYFSDDPEEDLFSYCGVYLKEEIQAEGLVRKIENFARFLESAALMNNELINFEAISNDAGFSARTIREYFLILEDTLVGTMLKPYQKTKKRKAISTAKFYFFDVGVGNALAGRKGIRPHTDLFGKLFEHLIFTELAAFLSYARDRRPLSFWRDQNGNEVDFLIGDEIAIEVKGTRMVTNRHLKGLRFFSEEINPRKKIVVSMDPSPRKTGEIDILPWSVFLHRLWSKEI